MKEKNNKKNWVYWLQYILVFSCISFFKDTDSYYPVYLMIGLFGCIIIYINHSKKAQKEDKKTSFEQAVVVAFSLFFTFAVILSNYVLFDTISYYSESAILFNRLYKYMLFIIVALGCFLIFYNILEYLKDNFRYFSCDTEIEKRFPVRVFGCSLMIICGIYTTIMFCCRYPGMFNSDSTSQIYQIISGDYTNHHPFWHTMLIKVSLTIGMTFFHSMTKGVLVYSLIQIVIMACIFSIAVATIYQIGLSKKLIFILFSWYAFLPIHITYSYAMWKDVLFGGTVLLFTIAAFRILYNVGGYSALNIALLCFGGIGTCLLRSNGFFVFMVSIVSFMILFRKKFQILLLVFIGIVLSAYIMKHPFLNAINVEQPDMIEMLSIPIQQMSEVVVECGDELTDEQKKLLENLASIEEIREAYEPGYSDPMKDLLRRDEQQKFLTLHKEEYIHLYLELGFAHPKEYLSGWIKQTRGYWNGGYKELEKGWS